MTKPKVTRRAPGWQVTVCKNSTNFTSIYLSDWYEAMNYANRMSGKSVMDALSYMAHRTVLEHMLERYTT